MYALSLLSELGGQLNWVMDAILKFCSFGWVSYAHNDFFIWQAQDAKRFKLLAPADPEQIKDIELKVGRLTPPYSTLGSSLLFLSVLENI